MITVETERLVLRPLGLEDAAFVLELVNDPSWLRYIGDRGIRTLDAARDYIRNGPMASHAKHGFGLDLAVRKADGAAVGICGLLKRDTLDDIDVGFALLPQFCGQGYAGEAAAAILHHGRSAFGLKRIVAITDPANAASIQLLEKLGFKFERLIRMAPDKPELKLFASEA
ncbi:MAG: Protein N-acetyltransferase, RimJ/RimL family [Lacunisphaera sp.]|nr:Protein N-acetyltransferase, RimJ/RimL family [Lacunisphaera sp.]